MDKTPTVESKKTILSKISETVKDFFNRDSHLPQRLGGAAAAAAIAFNLAACAPSESKGPESVGAGTTASDTPNGTEMPTGATSSTSDGTSVESDTPSSSSSSTSESSTPSNTPETENQLGPELKFDQETQVLSADIATVLTKWINGGATDDLPNRAYDENKTYDQLVPTIAQEVAGQYIKEYFIAGTNINDPQVTVEIAPIVGSNQNALNLYTFTAFRTENNFLPGGYTTKFTIKGPAVEVSNDGTDRVIDFTVVQSDNADQSGGNLTSPLNGNDIHFEFDLRNVNGTAKIVSFKIS